MYGGIFQTEVLTYGGDYIIDGYGLAFAVHDFAYNALRQFQIDFLVIYGGMSHDGDDDTFQITHTVAYILGYIVNNLRWKL